MRPRRLLVKVHRWLGIGIFLWVLIVGITGAYLVFQDGIEALLHPDRYTSSDGDLGADAAIESATAAMPEGSSVTGLSRPDNGRGVYQLYVELPLPEGAGEEELPGYRTVYVDPGTAEVNAVRDDEGGFSWWLYRGHMYLWQDNGVFGVFDPETGWCRRDDGGHEPGGAKGGVCDVLPDSMDLVGWLGAAFILVLLSGFYLWYWPGVRRWATALVVKRGRGGFALNLSLHRVIGLVFWVPLTVVAFTGIAFAFPNLNSWYENATPAARDFFLWTPPDSVFEGPYEGDDPITADEMIASLEERFPDRRVHYLDVQHHEPAEPLFAWVTRGFDPWTREGGAGNTYVAVHPYTGEVIYDAPPGEGNVFDQAWDDWQFPLHTGDFLGMTSRTAWVLVGISPLILATTGVVMQLQRRAKRKKRATRALATA